MKLAGSYKLNVKKEIECQKTSRSSTTLQSFKQQEVDDEQENDDSEVKECQKK